MKNFSKTVVKNIKNKTIHLLNPEMQKYIFPWVTPTSYTEISEIEDLLTKIDINDIASFVKLFVSDQFSSTTTENFIKKCIQEIIFTYVNYKLEKNKIVIYQSREYYDVLKNEEIIINFIEKGAKITLPEYFL